MIPQNIFDIIGRGKNSATGLMSTEIASAIQNDEHSGHVSGLLTIGILAVSFLNGCKISEKLHV